MLNKRFAERLNTELDSIGVPETSMERIAVLSKLIKVPKFKAEAFLNGNSNPDEATLTLLAQELEVNAAWLIGKSDSKSGAH